MNRLSEQCFPTDFILDYITEDQGYQRFVTYAIFRFLSCTGKEDRELLSLLKKMRPQACVSEDFACVEAYLTEDFYFSPSLEADTLDPVFLYDAISLARDRSGRSQAFINELIRKFCPVAAAASLSGPAPDLSAVVASEISFYGALCLAATLHQDNLPQLLPAFADIYWEELEFTCGDFVLFDFMDEYFEQKNCRLHPSFLELTDTLVQAALHYYKTDFDLLLETEIPRMLHGDDSRFAAVKRFGSLRFPAAGRTGTSDADSGSAKLRQRNMLEIMFRYAAIYELRNNLYDFHLDDDSMITLSNWKEKLRWHYVQYSNVYSLALSSFYTACLSNRLLKAQFETIVSSLC